MPQKLPGLRRSIAMAVAAVFTLLTMAAPVMVWADYGEPLSPDDVRSINTDTTWYDPNAQGECTQSGVGITGVSDFLNGDPLTLGYPNITDEAKFADAMQKFIEQKPESPWLKIPMLANDTNLGMQLLKEAKSRNINPMMIIGIGRKETQLGSTSGGSAAWKNSFGWKGSPHAEGSDYKMFPTFEASLFGEGSFSQFVQGNVWGRMKDGKITKGSYQQVRNMYEYLSVHVSGQIIYPGDTTTSHDSTMDQDITSKNVEGYFGTVAGWIGQMTGLTITGIPSRGGGCASCTQTYNGYQYSFPVDPCTKINYTDLPLHCGKKNYKPRFGEGSPSGGVSTCHHDNTPAFDLYWQNSSAEHNIGGNKVHAITDGVVKFSDRYNNVDKCYDLKFYSTTQNRKYWMGHLQKVPDYVKQGQEVKAGDVIAEVGNWELYQKGCSPGPPHLHISRACVAIVGIPDTLNVSNDPGKDTNDPQGTYGGADNCRDSAFMEELGGIWEMLPDDTGNDKEAP